MDVFGWIGDNWLALCTTGIAATSLWISLSVYRRQEKLQEPAMMASVLSYKNGVSLALTLRNRADHPMKVTGIAISGSKDTDLAELKGRPKDDVLLTEHHGFPALQMAITLASRDSSDGAKDRLKREYGLLSTTGLPARLWVEVSYDPSQGKAIKRRVRREVVIPPQHVGQRTAIQRNDAPRYSLFPTGSSPV